MAIKVNTPAVTLLTVVTRPDGSEDRATAVVSVPLEGDLSETWWELHRLRATPWVTVATRLTIIGPACHRLEGQSRTW